MQEIHVVGAAIRQGDKILAVQRSSKMKEPRKWEFAGGKIEGNETHQEALVREIKEELDIDIKVTRYVDTGSSVIDGKKIVLHVYEADILAGKPKLREHSAMQWIDVDRLDELDWAQADIPAYTKLMTEQRKNIII